MWFFTFQINNLIRVLHCNINSGIHLPRWAKHHRQWKWAHEFIPESTDKFHGKVQMTSNLISTAHMICPSDNFLLQKYWVYEISLVQLQKYWVCEISLVQLQMYWVCEISLGKCRWHVMPAAVALDPIFQWNAYSCLNQCFVGGQVQHRSKLISVVSHRTTPKCVCSPTHSVDVCMYHPLMSGVFFLHSMVSRGKTEWDRHILYSQEKKRKTSGCSTPQV